MDKTNGCFLVSWDFSNERKDDVIVVGERVNNKINIVNAFRGQQARDIYKKLSTIKKGGF